MAGEHTRICSTQVAQMNLVQTEKQDLQSEQDNISTEQLSPAKVKGYKVSSFLRCDESSLKHNIPMIENISYGITDYSLHLIDTFSSLQIIEKDDTYSYLCPFESKKKELFFTCKRRLWSNATEQFLKQALQSNL